MGVYHETRIRELERRDTLIDNDLRTLRRQVTAVREGVRDHWASGGGNVCLTTVRGIVGGCYTDPVVGLADATLRFVGAVTGIDYGIVVADDPELTGNDGAYLAELYLDPADTGLDVYLDGPGGRFDATVPRNIGVTQCATQTQDFQNIGAIEFGLVPASGYTQGPFPDGLCPCPYPISTTLNCTDSAYAGTITLTWDAVNGWWQGCRSGVAYPGRGSGPACAAATIAIQYRLGWDRSAGFAGEWHCNVRYLTVGGGSTCPAASTCASTFNASAAIPFSNTWTCPYPPSGTKFTTSMTIVPPTGIVLYPTGTTLTFQEP